MKMQQFLKMSAISSLTLHFISTGRDVARKLYQLNDNCINEKGFRYDVRLPCIMSIPDDVERRRKATALTFQTPATPGMDDGRTILLFI